jgi:tetratricopeptide (TPR) repeat protein
MRVTQFFPVVSILLISGIFTVPVAAQTADRQCYRFLEPELLVPEDDWLNFPCIEPRLVTANESTVNDRLTEASNLLEAGILRFKVSQYQEAFESWQQALSIFREANVRSQQPSLSRWGEASSLMRLGLIYNELKDSQPAIEYFERALFIFQSLNDRSGEAATFGNLGYAYKQIKQYQKSIEYSEAAALLSLRLKL